MDKVAGNLMNNVIEFFGILLPGVILAYLHSALLLTAFTSNANTGLAQIPADWSWVLVFIVSLILGHFLHAFSDPLDDLAVRFDLYHNKKKTKAYLEAAKCSITLPDGTPHTSKNYFYFVFSFIRIHNASAVAELERQSADYKFFRSLTLLFLLEIPLSVLDPYVSRNVLLGRLAAALLIACLAAIVSKLLFEWTYQLAFELYIQIRESEERRAAKCEA